MVLVKLPAIPASIVLVLNAVVGPVVVLQHIPAVKVAPRSDVIVPPLIADTEVILLAAVVLEIVGGAFGTQCPVFNKLDPPIDPFLFTQSEGEVVN